MILIIIYFSFLVECGAVVNNSLTSPWYPYNYPPDMDCTYWVPIPEGTTLIVTFEDFDLQPGGSSCR